MAYREQPCNSPRAAVQRRVIATVITQMPASAVPSIDYKKPALQNAHVPKPRIFRGKSAISALHPHKQRSKSKNTAGGANPTTPANLIPQLRYCRQAIENNHL